MKRVLLIIDDYGELLFLQTLLKKLGFDVDGIQKESNFEDSFLTLNPELIIATAKGKRINGIEIAEGLRRVRGLPKFLLVASGAMKDRLKGLQINAVDGILESPVSASQLLGMIADTCELDRASLLEKYRRIKATLSPDHEADAQILKRDDDGDAGEISVSGAAAPEAARPLVSPSTMTSEERERRYRDIVAKAEPVAPSRFPRDRIVEFTKEIRASEDPEETARLEEERQGFVKALFRKARS